MAVEDVRAQDVGRAEQELGVIAELTRSSAGGIP
jgi:hypothetical protein